MAFRLIPMRTVNAEWHHKFAWIALFLSFLAYPILLIRYSNANTAAFDEGEHIAAGYRYWECGDYGINPEHPPLLKLIAVFPVRHWQIGDFGAPCGAKATSNFELVGDGFRLVNSEHSDDLLRRARLATIVFPLLLLLTVFFFTRALFGPLAAGIGVLLTLFEPNLTAFGPLVLTDAAVASTTLLAVALAWSYARKPTGLRLLLLGLALGLALASKHSAAIVPFILLAEFGVDSWVRRGDPMRPTLTKLALGWIAACMIAVIVLWGTYQFRFNALPGTHPAELAIANELQAARETNSLAGRVVLVAARHHLLPESYLAGLAFVRTHATRSAYFFGKELAQGVWYYFPVALTIKTTLPLLLFLVLSLASRDLWRCYRSELIWIWLPVIFFLLGALTGKINIGIRHVLPIYPFLIIVASAAAAWWAQRSRAATIPVVVLLVWHAASYARSFPNEVGYANEAWGGPRQLHRYLGDSNVDVGQSLYRVKKYIAAHHIENCWIAWFGMREPSAVGVPCRPLPRPAFLEVSDRSLQPIMSDRFSGDVFVSTTLTNYDIFPDVAFRHVTPTDLVDGSTLVFHGNFDMPQIAAERRIARGWWYLIHGQPQQAVPELTAAARHAQSPGIAHSLLGWALQASGQLDEARLAYEQAGQDFAGRPADESARRSALQAAEELRKQLGKD
jgi:hypothetical protein